jgi:hypothetical protein
MDTMDSQILDGGPRKDLLTPYRFNTQWYIILIELNCFRHQYNTRPSLLPPGQLNGDLCDSLRFGGNKWD